MSTRHLSDALQKKAEIELNEVPSRISEDLKHIRDWLDKQPHLNVRSDDQWLLSFLRGCKYSLEKTKEKLDLFYTMRTLVPEFFRNRDPFQQDVQDTLSLGAHLSLTKTRDPDAPRVIIVRAGLVYPDRMSVMAALKTFTMCVDILVAEDDNYIIGGQHLLIDLRNITYKLAVQFTPNLLKKLTIVFQNAYPTRPQGIYFLNAPPLFDAIFNILKPLFSEKLKNRIGFYTDENLHTLYKVIPSAILPKEYGGEGDSLDKLSAEWKQKVESYEQWFRENEGIAVTKQNGRENHGLLRKCLVHTDLSEN